MTKAELIELLKPFSDDAIVKITYSCDNAYRNITDVNIHPRNGYAIIESAEMPDEDDIFVMAENYYNSKDGDVFSSARFEWFLFGKSTEEQTKEWHAYIDSLKKKGLAT